jgi:GTP-binding protein HflX
MAQSDPRERALLVAVTTGGEIGTDASLEELSRLVDTAGAETVDFVVQRRERLDPATLLGKGKLSELRQDVAAGDIDVVVFDREISPAQERNLSSALDRRVLDRTAVILDIFAQHAASREGKIQVELAQLEYRLPRLRGKGVELSRLGGGIGTRGPGETKLEVDRRRILSRIARLKRQLRELEQARHTKRERRKRQEMPLVAIVGYTNAGKSSLLNALTGADALVEDQLFATVDPTTRRLELSEGRVVLVSDTVGFVRQLPHQLIEAFKSTLEEASEADLLLHLVDLADEDPEAKIGAVREVLAEIGADRVPEVLAGNKADIATSQAADRFRGAHPEAVVVSAAVGSGLEVLGEALWQELSRQFREVQLLIPFSAGSAVGRVHEVGEVLAEKYRPDGVWFRARLSVAEAQRLGDYVIDSPWPADQRTARSTATTLPIN